MNWSNQTDSMMKVWAETQKKMWESWFDIGQTMPAGSSSFGPMFQQWQKMMTQSMGMWSGSGEKTTQNASRQLLATQSSMMRFLELTVKAWNAMIPKMEEGNDWQTVLNEYMGGFRDQMLSGPSKSMQAMTGSSDLWQAYLTYLQQTTAPWLKAWQVAPSHMGVAMAGEGPSEMIELANLYWQAYDQTFGMMVNTPGVGLTRELSNKISQGFEAWKTLTQAMDDYQYLILDAWSGVMEQVMRDMMKRTEQGQPVQSIRELVKMWTGAADKSFAQVATSEKYAEVQGRFLSSYMDYRIKEQQIVEEFLRYSYVPTRSEMDEAHRNVYELRKEVKALKKALKADGKGVPARATAGSEA